MILLTVCLLKGLHWNSLALFWRQSSFGWRLCVWWNLCLGSPTAWSPPLREKHCKWIYWLCQSFPYRGRWCFSVLLQTIAQCQPILSELNNTVGVIQFTNDFLPRYHNTTEHLGVVPSLLPLFNFAFIWSHDLMCWNCFEVAFLSPDNRWFKFWFRFNLWIEQASPIDATSLFHHHLWKKNFEFLEGSLCELTVTVLVYPVD